MGAELKGNRIYIGIDPDTHGGIAVLQPCGRIEVIPFVPVVKRKSLQVVDAKLSLRQNIGILRDALLGYPHSLNESIYVLIEQQTYMPLDGKDSVHYTGYFEGILHGALACSGVVFETISAKEWKKAFFGTAHLKLDREQQKALALQRARELFPSLADQLKHKNDSGLAEALLIALVCKQQFGGQEVATDNGWW